MKINLEDIDLENFILREGTVAGETAYLVFPPHIGVKWTKKNLIFRSSLWNKDGELISASFPKFFNWGEQPDLAHTPFSTTANGGINVVTKEDGSTLIVSKYKGELITRTRGTFDTSVHDTGAEVGYLIEKYPKAFDFGGIPLGDSPPYSLIFEWVTPDNPIVIHHPEPDIILIGCIMHKDYSFVTQRELDEMAEEMGVRRPETHHYDKIKDILEDVTLWEGTEGVCVYSKKDQSIRKVKSEWYLALHRMKSELGSYKRVVDVFFGLGKPKYTDFYDQLEELYDFEIAQRAIPHMSIICDGYKEVEKIVEGMNKFIDKRVKVWTERKEQALEILGSYGKTNRSGYVFKLLDGKELSDDDHKKLLYQVTDQKDNEQDSDTDNLNY